jgi:hypothetical protein
MLVISDEMVMNELGIRWTKSLNQMQVLRFLTVVTKTDTAQLGSELRKPAASIYKVEVPSYSHQPSTQALCSVTKATTA